MVAFPKHNRFYDITDVRFGRLVVIGYAGKRGVRHFWNCKCDCGKSKTVEKSNLTSGNTTSCGCFALQLCRNLKMKHGLCRTKEYTCWTLMIRRCEKKNCREYKHYGGRGITVCRRWRKSFTAFLKDMGNKPTPKHSLDRINNNDSYRPGNCRWATWRQQRRNTRRVINVTHDGRTQCLSDWSSETGIAWIVLYRRLFIYNWTPKEAMTIPTSYGPQMRR